MPVHLLSAKSDPSARGNLVSEVKSYSLFEWILGLPRWSAGPPLTPGFFVLTLPPPFPKAVGLEKKSVVYTVVCSYRTFIWVGLHMYIALLEI